jgi:hypothetical protein
MKITNLKIPVSRIFFWLLLITLVSVTAFKNQKILCVYYKLLDDNEIGG